MIDQVKSPVVDQPAKFRADVGREKSSDRDRILDLLEDDEVRELLKRDVASPLSKADGKPAHD